MSIIDNINNNFAANNTFKKIVELSQDKDAFTKVIDGATAPKYKDLAELQDSGNSHIYNQALHDMVMKDVYETANASVSDRLAREELAVVNIKKIIDEFNDDMVTVRQNFPEVMTKTQACDKALTAIERVLNTQDSEGKYLFGGISSTDKPCVDLTTFSNLDSAGNILNNYTGATPNPKTVAIGDGTTIQIGFDASNKTFSTLIGTLNKLKASANAVPTAAENETLQKELNIAVIGLESIQSTIINNKKSIEEAKENTDNKYKEATNLLNSSKFVLSTQELVQKMFEFSKSQRVLEAIQMLNNKMSDRLVNIVTSSAA